MGQMLTTALIIATKLMATYSWSKGYPSFSSLGNHAIIFIGVLLSIITMNRRCKYKNRCNVMLHYMSVIYLVVIETTCYILYITECYHPYNNRPMIWMILNIISMFNILNPYTRMYNSIVYDGHSII